jgi:hypothetical protein
MDPDATLATIRENLAIVDSRNDTPLPTETLVDAIDTLVTATKALDEWLSNGGFRPAAWQR